MSNELIDQFHLTINQDIFISIGKKTISLRIVPEESESNEILLPEEIIKEFFLPIQAYQFQAVFLPDKNTLQLGPIIGLVTDYSTDEHGEPQFRTVQVFCEELHHGITESCGFFYVFSHKDFPLKGYYFQNGKWIYSELPLPDVIYNRIHSRRTEHSNNFKHFRSTLDTFNIPFFNDRFLSKWEVYEHLMKEKHLHRFTPETRLFSKDNLYELLALYPVIFIKPIHGSQGKNIIKLVKTDEEHYTVQSSLESMPPSFDNICLDDLFQQIKSLLGNRIYIIQQGIPLMCYQGCPMDFRALCHKNKKKQWQVTSLVARISAEQEFVSNVSRGGMVLKPLAALQTAMTKNQALVTIDLIKELSLKIAETISTYSSGLTGELGIDIGVDVEGNLGIIEVNFKPSKSFEDGNMKIRPSAKAIIEFCTMLSFDKEESRRNQR